MHVRHLPALHGVDLCFFMQKTFFLKDKRLNFQYVHQVFYGWEFHALNCLIIKLTHSNKTNQKI